MTLKEQLIRDEGGYQKFAYQDSRGLWTVGYGRCIDRSRGKGVSQTEADLLLDNDIRDTIGDLTTALPWMFGSLNDARIAVLVNMAFNLGVAGLLEFHKTLEAVKAGDWEQAAYHMLDSKWAEQVGERAKELAKMVQTGDYP